MTVTNDIDDLSFHFAEWMLDYITDTLSKQDRFTIALSGGSTPKKLYQLLASETFHKRINWTRLHFFWGDERVVPYDDPRNNARMAFETLLDKVPVSRDHIHIIDTSIDPERAAREYEQVLHRYFDNHPHTFDLVLLGLGDNAHTLSLFPDYPVIRENRKWVASFYLKEQEMYRVTLTAPIVNAAGRVAFLVSGGDKAAAVYHILGSDHDPDLYPAQIIQPFNGELYWFFDKAAAADL